MEKSENNGNDLAPEVPHPEKPVEIPIDGALDLHTIPPRHVKEVVLEYLRLCSEKGIESVRIIHGKGVGNLRRTVHALLQKHPQVISYGLANEFMGGWGATMVQLKTSERREPSS